MWIAKKVLRIIVNRIYTIRLFIIGSVLYRDLLIIKAIPKYSATNRLFFGKQIPVLISEPECMGKSTSLLLQAKLGVHAPVRKYCDTFDDVIILGGGSPIALNSDRKPLWNAIAYQFFNFDRSYTPIEWFIRQNFNSKWVEQEYVIFLCSTWSSNYYHWLFDNLARLQVLNFLDDEIKARVKILVGSKLSTFQSSSLAALGFKNIEYIEDKNYRIKHLLVPNFPLEQQGYDLDQILWLKNKILKNTEFDTTNTELIDLKILILRKPSAGRAFLNQDQILEALIPIGFKTFYLEELSFEQQVRLFKQAKYVVAAHGAGLANIIFADRAIVIEIFAEQVFPCYFQLAKTLGLKYGFHLCDADRRASSKNQDMYVDIASLLKLIQSLGDAQEGS